MFDTCNVFVLTVGRDGESALEDGSPRFSWWIPYLDTLRWVFITAALFGIAVAIHARIDDWKRGQR